MGADATNINKGLCENTTGPPPPPTLSSLAAYERISRLTTTRMLPYIMYNK